jgi:transglutaminase-like putative cysteine protease
MTESPRESLHRVRWTLLALGGGLLPHVFHLPMWVSMAVIAAALWRLVIAHRQGPLPSRALRILGAVLALVAVLVSYRTINGLDAGTALLALMAALKLLETRELRDHVLLILIGCFLLLAEILYNQSLLLLPYYAFAVWLSITALCAVTRASGIMPWRRALAMSGRMLLFAAPLALLLFLLFPRVPGPFWALPNSSRAESGLGDEMTPGEISDLTLSDDPAFRVRFHGAVPSPIDRYWRGPVLHDFDGYTWRRARSSFLPRQPLRFSGPRYAYRIMLEPNNRTWLFALDQPAEWQGDETVFQGYDYQLQLSRPVTQPLSYELASFTRHASDVALAQSVRRRETQLPAGRNPRTLVLAAGLRTANPDNRAYVAAVLDLFVRQGFTYTLTPPKLEPNSVDDFLFNTRQGFCGHYASAFTMLMRAAGIPARVVTGYQGGVYNRIGEYWYVGQADAHAWSEIWFEGVGWQRVDPTAVVAPERLEQGLDAARSERAGSADSWLGTANWLRQVGFAWDAANTWWRDRVLEFDQLKQRAFLEWLGIPDPDWAKLGILLAAAFAGFLLWITFALRRELIVRTRDPLLAVYQRFCRAAARLGVERRPDEGPIDFAARLKLALPDAATAIDEFIGAFVRARYLAPLASADIEGLTRLARTLDRRRVSK